MITIDLKNAVETRVLIAETGRNLGSFAKSVDISPGYLSQILRGERNPSVTTAYKIADGLGKEVEEIFLIKNVAKLHP